MTEGALEKEREATIDGTIAAVDTATLKSVTIDEKQNMEQSPSSSAFVDNAAMPALKDAGAEGQRLESRARDSSSPSNQIHAASPSPSPSPSPVKYKHKASPSPAKSKEITDKERAKAKYLLNRAYHSGRQSAQEIDARRDNDRYSSYSGSSASSYGSKRSVKTVESDIARRLRKSQQRLRDSQERHIESKKGDDSSDAALQAVFSSLTEQQQTLFMSMKGTKSAARGSSHAAGSKKIARAVALLEQSLSPRMKTRARLARGTLPAEGVVIVGIGPPPHPLPRSAPLASAPVIFTR